MSAHQWDKIWVAPQLPSLLIWPSMPGYMPCFNPRLQCHQL